MLSAISMASGAHKSTVARHHFSFTLPAAPLTGEAGGRQYRTWDIRHLTCSPDRASSLHTPGQGGTKYKKTLIIKSKEVNKMTIANNRKMTILSMFIAVLIPLLIGGLSAFLTSGDMKIFESMNHPPLAPPGWLFPIAWTILYIIMGVASFLVFISGADPGKKRTALMLYAGQLIMNFFWTTLFFTYSQYFISLIWILGMWVLTLLCAVRFYRIKRIAGLMMGILLLWTTFATYLNTAYYIMSITPMPIAV